VLRRETVGGALLLVATVVAMVWANSPWAATYTAVREASFGPASLHLHLTVSEWAADGLLAVFFFVAGLELKREFVAGNLRDPRRRRCRWRARSAGWWCPRCCSYSSTATPGTPLCAAGRFRSQPTSRSPLRYSR
jgi:NhaA family Na+:H+ antiporter